jgi:hypothetical protein
MHNDIDDVDVAITPTHMLSGPMGVLGNQLHVGNQIQTLELMPRELLWVKSSDY